MLAACMGGPYLCTIKNNESGIQMNKKGDRAMKRIKKTKTIAQLAAKTATRLVANCNLISRYSGIPLYHCRFYNYILAAHYR